MIQDRIYREVIGRAEKGKIPIYPSVIRQKAISRYEEEKQAELEQLKKKTEEEIRKEEIRRIKREEKRRKEAEEAAKAATQKVHAGSWVKITGDGRSVSAMGIAAMSPSEAKARGYKWGTSRSVDGKFEFVSLPGEPTESEYYGILEWKHKEGHYKRPEVEAQIKKEIEFGSKKYGITAPAWAGGYLKQYETAAKTIKSAYLKAAEAAEKPTEIEMKKEKPPPTKKITIEDVLKYQKVSEIEQRPEVRQYIETTVGTGETATEVERGIRGQEELVRQAEKLYKEYEKGGWTPEEIRGYSLLAGATQRATRELQPKIVKFEKGKEALVKQEEIPIIKEYKARRTEFEKTYTPSQIKQIEESLIVQFPFKVQEKEGKPIIYHPLAKGEIPEIVIPEKEREVSLPPHVSAISFIKKLTGYYPEKKVGVEKGVTSYKARQIEVAESLGVVKTDKKTGKKYVLSNGKRYTEGTGEFDERIGSAIQKKITALEERPEEVERRQKAIETAMSKQEKFMETYGGTSGEPVILITPESRKAYRELETSLKAIPSETFITKSYWENVEKLKAVQPSIKEMNVLAEQITKQQEGLSKVEREKWLGIPTKIESIEQKYSPYIKKIIPPVRPYAQIQTAEDFLKAYETTRKHQYEARGLKYTPLTKKEEEEILKGYREGEEASKVYRRLFGLSPELYEWERKLGELKAGFKAGMVEEIRDHPVKGVATIVSFAALPPALKGVKEAARITGITTKVPRLSKYVPKAVLGAFGMSYAGVVGYETYKVPTYELKGEVLGRTAIEFAEMGLGTYIGVKLPGKISTQFRGLTTMLTREKVPLSTITTEELASGRKKLGKVPEEVSGRELVRQFKRLQREYSLAGEKFRRGVKVWRSAPEYYGVETIVRRGGFEMPGMYTAPYVVPYFLRTKPQKVDIRLFGTEPAMSLPGMTPTYYRITTRGITRVPEYVRRTGIPSSAAWMLGRGRVERGYISVPFEYGKREAESVIGVTTGLRKTRGAFYSTTPEGKPVPIEEMETFITKLPRVPVGFEKGKYYVKRPRGTAIIETEKGIVLHPGERGEGYILPGGEIETRAVRALRGEIGRGETPLAGTAREIFEELGIKGLEGKRLFKLRGKGISLYTRPGGRQKWYSKNIYEVFEFGKFEGKIRKQQKEIKDIVYYKPGMDIRLSEDTRKILNRYFRIKAQYEIGIPIPTRRTYKRSIPTPKKVPETVYRERDMFRYEEEVYRRVPKEVSLISPEYLGIKQLMRSSIPKGYRKVVDKYGLREVEEKRISIEQPYFKQPTTEETIETMSRYTMDRIKQPIPPKVTQLTKRKIEYQRVDYPKGTYPDIDYPKGTYPDIAYPETGYPEVTYPPAIDVPTIKIPPIKYLKEERKKKKRKERRKEPYEWFVKHQIPTIEYLFGRSYTAEKNGKNMMERVLTEVPRGLK